MRRIVILLASELLIVASAFAASSCSIRTYDAGGKEDNSERSGKCRTKNMKRGWFSFYLTENTRKTKKYANTFDGVADYMVK